MNAKRALLWLVVLSLAVPSLGACESAPEQPRKTTVAAGTTGTVNLGDRPFQLHVPRSYSAAVDAGTKLPLLVLLHGYTSHAAEAESYFKLTAESERRGFLYAMPEGTKDQRGKQYWNATEACCDFYGGGADDSGYLARLIGAVKADYAVDAQRVYFVGHSNGGFMSYRMACDHAGVITAIVSLAGAGASKPERCQPERAVSVAQIHGTADETISFDGGFNSGQQYPSAAETVAFWRKHNGCGDQPEASTTPLDLESGLAGAETAVTAYHGGCRDGARVELWSMKDARHVPALSGNFAPSVVDFLLGRVS